MASLNRVLIIGNLGQDPELKRTSSGTAVTTLSVATNFTAPDSDGNLQEQAEWHRAVVWGRQAELCAQYLSKGRTVFIEGRLHTRSWDDAQGVRRYTTEIIANNVQFLGGAAPQDVVPQVADMAPRSRRASKVSGRTANGGEASRDVAADVPF